MLLKSPDFNENDLGFSSFARFLEQAKKNGLIELERDRKSGGYRVLPSDEADHGDDDTDDGDDAVEPWSDPYLPKGCERVCAVLEQAKLPVLSASVRKDVLAALEETVSERKKKRRKVTIGLVRDDMVKNRLRRTHPELPSALLKSVFDGLLTSGEFIHRDGTAIRSASASFHLEKDADGLNQSLVALYLAHLVDAGAEVNNTSMLAELFYGDADRRRDIEETLAWLHTAAEGSDDDDDDDDDDDSDDSSASSSDLDLDDLLVIDDDGDKGKEEAKAEEPKPKRSRSRSRSKKSEESESEPSSDSDDEAEEPKKKPARKRTRKKKTETAEEEAPAADDDKPKRKRTRKKKAEPAESDASSSDGGGDDLDALLEIG
jgi:hypothetical protein